MTHALGNALVNVEVVMTVLMIEPLALDESFYLRLSNTLLEECKFLSELRLTPSGSTDPLTVLMRSVTQPTRIEPKKNWLVRNVSVAIMKRFYHTRLKQLIVVRTDTNHVQVINRDGIGFQPCHLSVPCPLTNTLYGCECNGAMTLTEKIEYYWNVLVPKLFVRRHALMVQRRATETWGCKHRRPILGNCQCNSCVFYEPFRKNKQIITYVIKCLRWICVDSFGQSEAILRKLSVPCWMLTDKAHVRDLLRFADCLHFTKQSEYRCHLEDEQVVQDTMPAWESYCDDVWEACI